MSAERLLIDSHCHLDFEQFDEDRDELIARAEDAGVGKMVTICTRVNKFDQVKAVAEKYDNVFCSVGTHPLNAGEEPDIPYERLLERSPRENGKRPTSFTTLINGSGHQSNHRPKSTSPRRQFQLEPTN